MAASLAGYTLFGPRPRLCAVALPPAARIPADPLACDPFQRDVGVVPVNVTVTAADPARLLVVCVIAFTRSIVCSHSARSEGRATHPSFRQYMAMSRRDGAYELVRGKRPRTLPRRGARKWHGVSRQGEMRGPVVLPPPPLSRLVAGRGGTGRCVVRRFGDSGIKSGCGSGCHPPASPAWAAGRWRTSRPRSRWRRRCRRGRRRGRSSRPLRSRPRPAARGGRRR